MWREHRQDAAAPAERDFRRGHPFRRACALLQSLGFERRVRGSHHVFRKAGVEERINLQRGDHNAKPYQVKQVRSVILKSKLGKGE